MTHRTVYREVPLRVVYEILKGEPSTDWVHGVPQDIEIDRIITDHGDEIGSMLVTDDLDMIHAHVLAELMAEWKIEEKSL
jgi:hypothetical protein